MRRLALVLIALNLLVLSALPSSAGGDKDVAAIIEKAVKAHFPKGMDAKKEAIRFKSKGTIHDMGLEVEFTSEFWTNSGKFKQVAELNAMGQKINVITVFNDKE